MPGYFIDKSLLIAHPPPDMMASSHGHLRKTYFNRDSFVTPNTMFRYEISSGFERLFHARDVQYGFIKKHLFGQTPFYLADKERVLGLLGELGTLQSQYPMLTPVTNGLLKQEILDGVEENTDLTQS